MEGKLTEIQSSLREDTMHPRLAPGAQALQWQNRQGEAAERC